MYLYLYFPTFEKGKVEIFLYYPFSTHTRDGRRGQGSPGRSPRSVLGDRSAENRCYVHSSERRVGFSCSGGLLVVGTICIYDLTFSLDLSSIGGPIDFSTAWGRHKSPCRCGCGRGLCKHDSCHRH